MRKLWLVAKEQRKNELERLAAGDETAKGRVNVPGALAMETAAIKEGRVRCALLRFRVAEPTRLDSSYHARGATFEHLSWRWEVHLEEELCLSRAGKVPKNKGELVFGKDQTLTIKTWPPPASAPDTYGEKPPIWKSSENTWESEAKLLPTSKSPTTRHISCSCRQIHRKAHRHCSSRHAASDTSGSAPI